MGNSLSLQDGAERKKVEGPSNKSNDKKEKKKKNRNLEASSKQSPNDNNNNIVNNNKNNSNNHDEIHKKEIETVTKKDFPCDIVVHDPRGDDPTRRMTMKESKLPFVDSFDPSSTYHRPDIRVHVSLPTTTTTNNPTVTSSSQQHQQQQRYPNPLRHDDVVIAPDFFGSTNDWSLYHTLLQEMFNIQPKENWVSWHYGAHLLVKNPKESPTYNKIIDQLCSYFQIRKDSIGTRFNWYKDNSDWKPFHHDSAAFDPERAAHLNITVTVSFGATRELAFLRKSGSDQYGNNNSRGENNITETRPPCRLYFPQPNNTVFTFGRDVNIRWMHGINALPPDQQKDQPLPSSSSESQINQGRISIILWGWAQNVIEEDGSPPLLLDSKKTP